MPGTVDCSFIGRPEWQETPSADFSPGSNTIYVFHGVTANLLHLYNDCFAILNPSEQDKGLRYYQVQHQQRYVIQHGILRLLLGRYLNTLPQSLGFSYNATQKPYLASPQSNCYFNISHTKCGFLIAVSDVELGVDIEYINASFIYQDIASNYFSADEVAFINASPNATGAFFLLWTRKEALLKACGTGIDDNLPAMPALDGLHHLPKGYDKVHWRTESFYVPGENMGSITYPSPKNNIEFLKLDTGFLKHLF